MFFLWILIIFFLIIILFLNSTIKIEFKNVEFKIPKEDSKYFNKQMKVILKLYLLGLIKLFSKNLTNIKIDEKKFNNQINKIRNDMKKKRLQNIESINNLKKLEIELQEMDLKIIIGMENAAFSAIISGFISSIIAIILHNKITNLEKQKYFVQTEYENKNLLRINFDSIIVIKIKHIIYMIINLYNKKVK